MNQAQKRKLYNALKGDSEKTYVWRNLLKLKVGEEINLHVYGDDLDRALATMRSYVSKFRLLAGGRFRVRKPKNFNHCKYVIMSRLPPKYENSQDTENPIAAIKSRDTCKGFIFTQLDGLPAGKTCTFELPESYKKESANAAINLYQRMLLCCDLLWRSRGREYIIHRIK